MLRVASRSWRYVQRMKWKLLAGAGGVAGALYVRRLARGRELLENPFGEVTRYYRWRGGKIAYTVAGEGEPVLLVHGIYAGASSHEFRRNFGELSRSFRVYAVDLLGCGLSDRPRRRYVPADITDQLEDFVREEVGEAAHVIASSLGAALFMPAAVRSPRLFRRLIFICPTGLQSLNRRPGRLNRALYGLLYGPLGDPFYYALVSRPSLRYYLRNMAYHRPEAVSEGVLEQYYRTSHQPGAKYLPAAFISGMLNLDVRGLYPRIPHQSLIVWGNEARTTPVGQAEAFLYGNPRSNLRIFRDAALLPHDERAGKFNEISRRFLRSGSPGHAGRRAT
jgi:pimeloyl-ACP methyl ester carboxylesterase